VLYLQATTSTSTAAASGEDLFKDDPFGSKATTTGGSADPFSGQDPFSSDPFSMGASDKKDTTQVREGMYFTVFDCPTGAGFRLGCL